MREKLLQLFEPTDGYGRLLDAVFCIDKPNLQSDEAILAAIQNGAVRIPLTDKDKEVISNLLSTIEEREDYVVRRYFGIDREVMTLQKIALELGLSRERVRQIKERSLRRLRHPKRIKCLRMLPCWSRCREYAIELQDALRASEKIRQKEKDEEELTRQAIARGEIPKSILETPIEESYLSARTFNCLDAAGIKTLGQLCSYRADDLLKYRNFGRKSLNEILDILSQLGLSLAGE